MLVRLTRNQRKKAGWIVAIVYLLCVMAPTLSYALPGQHAVVDCMTIEGVASGSMHMHGQPDTAGDRTGAQVSGDASIQDSGHDAHVRMASMSDDDASMSGAMSDEEAPIKKGPHTTSGQCCALMCIGAMPATIAEIASPSVPTPVRATTEYRATADNAPDVHYRPPHRLI